MENKRMYESYKKGDVVYLDLGRKPHGVEGGIRPCVVISCDASNHKYAPQIVIAPLSSKLKQNPVHVVVEATDVEGYPLKAKSDCLIENTQTVAKAGVRGRVGYIPRKSKVMEEIDLAIIKEFQLEDTINKILKGELRLYEKTKEREAIC